MIVHVDFFELVGLWLLIMFALVFGALIYVPIWWRKLKRAMRPRVK